MLCTQVEICLCTQVHKKVKRVDLSQTFMLYKIEDLLCLLCS